MTNLMVTCHLEIFYSNISQVLELNFLHIHELYNKHILFVLTWTMLTILAWYYLIFKRLLILLITLSFLMQLEALVLMDSAVQWIRSYLSDRQTLVDVAGLFFFSNKYLFVVYHIAHFMPHFDFNLCQ